MKFIFTTIIAFLFCLPTYLHADGSSTNRNLKRLLSCNSSSQDLLDTSMQYGISGRLIAAEQLEFIDAELRKNQRCLRRSARSLRAFTQRVGRLIKKIGVLVGRGVSKLAEWGSYMGAKVAQKLSEKLGSVNETAADTYDELTVLETELSIETTKENIKRLKRKQADLIEALEDELARAKSLQKKLNKQVKKAKKKKNKEESSDTQICNTLAGSWQYSNGQLWTLSPDNTYQFALPSGTLVNGVWGCVVKKSKAFITFGRNAEERYELSAGGTQFGGVNSFGIQVAATKIS